MDVISPRQESPSQRRLGLGILAVSLSIGLGLRVWLSLNDDGIHWPDEIYQSLEPAHRVVFGYGLLAWEFQEGARTWLFPGAIAGMLKVASIFGWNEPRAYLTFVRVAFSVLSLGAATGAYLLARAYRCGTVGSALAAAIVALSGPLIFLAPRAFSEGPSEVLVSLGLAISLWPAASAYRRAAGASLLGLSVILRLQNALFAAGFVAVLAARRQWRQAMEAAGVLAVWVVFLGVLDRLTWGGWFATVITYVSFNLDPVKMAMFEKPPPDYYVLGLLTSMTLLALAVALLAPFGAVRAPGLALVAVGFIVVHSVIAHKELRYVMPAFPLLASLAGLGANHFLERPVQQLWVGRAVVAGVLLCAAVSAATFPQLTFGDLGQTGRVYFDHDGKQHVVRADERAFDQPGALNRLLFTASSQRDLCGLKVEPMDLVYTGGYSYLHRNVSFYGRESAADPSLFNYVIVLGSPPPGEVRASENGFSLVRVRASCASALASGEIER